MNTSLNFSIDELLSYNNSINEVRGDIKQEFSSISNNFTDLSQNVKGDKINSIINDIISKTNSLDKQMTQSFANLSDFLTSQMQYYATSYEEAMKIFKAAIDYINNNMNSTGLN